MANVRNQLYNLGENKNCGRSWGWLIGIKGKITRKLDGDVKHLTLGTWAVGTNRSISQGAVDKREILTKSSSFKNVVHGGMSQHEKE